MIERTKGLVLMLRQKHEAPPFAGSTIDVKPIMGLDKYPEPHYNCIIVIKSSRQGDHMAKAMTKTQLAARIAENAGIKKKLAVEILEEIAAIAYKEAKNSFTLPGLGKLVLVQRKARMGRNPATGEAIKIPAKKVVKFRVAKAAKEAILGKK
jgi:DNA-binding protein HU-beta